MQPYCMDEAAVRRDVERGLGLHRNRPGDVTANPNVLRPIKLTHVSEKCMRYVVVLGWPSLSLAAV